MTLSDNGYEIRILDGVLLVNGQPVEDWLDCLDRRYSVATPSPINRELCRLVRMAFERGAEAEREGANVPAMGDVR